MTCYVLNRFVSGLSIDLPCLAHLGFILDPARMSVADLAGQQSADGPPTPPPTAAAPAIAARVPPAAATGPIRTPARSFMFAPRICCRMRSANPGNSVSSLSQRACSGLLGSSSAAVDAARLVKASIANPRRDTRPCVSSADRTGRKAPCRPDMPIPCLSPNHCAAGLNPTKIWLRPLGAISVSPLRADQVQLPWMQDPGSW